MYQVIFESSLKIKKRTAHIHCADDFLMSPEGMEKLDAICMQLVTIGESLKNLDKVTDYELLSTYPNIPWKQVKGLRDIIVHHYFDVDAEQIWWIVDKELEPLLSDDSKISWYNLPQIFELFWILEEGVMRASRLMRGFKTAKKMRHYHDI